MTKGLKALKSFLEDVNACVNSGGIYSPNRNNITIIEQELKALEIIKEMKCFKFYEIEGQYFVSGVNVPKEKYDLLKEVLL